MMNTKIIMRLVAIIIATMLPCLELFAQEKKPKTEADYYRISTLPIPEPIKMEVGGLQALPDGRLAVATRRGEIWLVDNPYKVEISPPRFHRWAHGLHEPLGLLFKKDHFIVAQRGEITRVGDTNQDGIADDYQALAKFGLTGNYHQYFYGPVALDNNEMAVSVNLDLVDGTAISKGNDWMGWTLKLDENGKLEPWATGMRSPAGIGTFRGDIFFTENQGNWVGSGYMTHLAKGDFSGNPDGLKWADDPDSPVQLRKEDIISTGEPLHEVASRTPGFKKPAVWFPYTLMGISTSDFKEDKSKGEFGPFEGQIFVGDFGHSKIMRAFMEKVKGEWQGACFPFLEGFSSGVFRLEWGIDGSLFVGQTNRGWRSFGQKSHDIQRVVWTGETPFEMKEIRSVSDGFEISFTKPVDVQSLHMAKSWEISSFTYQYQSKYGSPVVNHEVIEPLAVYVSEDGHKAGIVLKPSDLRKGYIFEIKGEGIRSAEEEKLLHAVGYYTLNEVADYSNSKKYNPTSLIFERVVTPVHADHSHHGTKPSHVKRQSQKPDSWSNGPDQVVVLKTKPGLKFDLDEVHVKAGSKIEWKFDNNDDMLHNCVITTPGTIDTVGDAAMKLGLSGDKLNYIPESQDVLFHTGTLQPGTDETIYFNAPDTPGTYHYLCTFPGHFQLMRGKLYVVE